MALSLAQEPAPPDELYSPAGQSVHVVDPAVEYEPAGHWFGQANVSPVAVL